MLHRMMELLLELIRSDDDALIISGAWTALGSCIPVGRLPLATAALEFGVFELVVTHLHALGGPADWLVLSRARVPGAAGGMLGTLSRVFKNYAGQPQRPDFESAVASGMFGMCLEALTAFAAAGVDALSDTDHWMVQWPLSFCKYCRSFPVCEPQIRSVAPALAFCLDTSLDAAEELGMTTQASAVQVCCAVFGRDEDGSEFAFTQQQIDLLVNRWSQGVRGVGWFITNKPSADTIMALELAVSDKNKHLLLSNCDFIPYLVDALLLDPAHPRAGDSPRVKAWCQQHHTECAFRELR
jgi:hypothetical protein